MASVVAGGAPAVDHPPQRAVIAFANASIGYGAAGTQEELVFGMRPEACVATLFVPRLAAAETCVVTGARLIGTYTGFGRGVRWAGALAPATPCPCSTLGPGPWHAIVAMDALEFDADDCERAASGALADIPDLAWPALQRELTKAYCGFRRFQGWPPRRWRVCAAASGSDKATVGAWRLSDDGSAAAEPAGGIDSVASGPWGCGAFGGHAQSKALVQACAASAAGVTLVYHELDDGAGIGSALAATVGGLAKAGVSVGELVARLASIGRGDLSDAPPTTTLLAAVADMGAGCDAST